MPRCLMAKKWKAYPWPERPEPPDHQDEDEEIDVVGDAPSCWGPSSPTAGATAPSPPPTSPNGTTLVYNGRMPNQMSHCVTTHAFARNATDSGNTRLKISTVTILNIFFARYVLFLNFYGSKCNRFDKSLT